MQNAALQRPGEVNGVAVTLGGFKFFSGGTLGNPYTIPGWLLAKRVGFITFSWPAATWRIQRLSKPIFLDPYQTQFLLLQRKETLSTVSR